MRTLVAVLAFVVLGCLASCDTRRSSFIEPVTLSDGRTIMLKRQQDFDRGGDMAEPSWNLARSALRVVDGDFPSAEWEDYAVMPMLLDVEGDSLVLIGIAVNEHPKRASRIPKPPYFQYRLRADGWVPEPVSALFWRRPPNLIDNVEGGRLLSHEVTADEKRELLKINPRVTRKFRMIDPDASAYDIRR